MRSDIDDSGAPLRAEGLVKRFRQGESVVEALRGVSLTVARGELVAIMGASGSGKSTLLHALAGLTDVDAGRVMVEGRDLGGMSDAELTAFRRRRIGLVFQSFNLIASLTAEDNVLLPTMADRSLQPAAAKLDALLERLGIAHRRRHRPDALSGGEQQRVAIARALLTDPAIVLADEPTGSLDSTSGRSICELLSGLCREEGRSIVVVTHEPAVAAWASRVVILQDGRDLTEFSTAEVGGAQGLAARYQEATSAALACSTAPEAAAATAATAAGAAAAEVVA